MSKTNTFENEQLLHEFNNTDIANVGDATGLRGSVAAGDFDVALLTASPGETGSLAAEATYTGYARLSVPRTSGGFTVSGNQVSNTAELLFGTCTAGAETLTHFAFLKAGTNIVTRYGQITSPASGLAVSAGIQPRFAPGVLVVTED